MNISRKEFITGTAVCTVTNWLDLIAEPVSIQRGYWMPMMGKYAPRPMAIQEIKWDADGWPYFVSGKPSLIDY